MRGGVRLGEMGCEFVYFVRMGGGGVGKLIFMMRGLGMGLEVLCYCEGCEGVRGGRE